MKVPSYDLPNKHSKTYMKVPSYDLPNKHSKTYRVTFEHVHISIWHYIEEINYMIANVP